MRIAATTSAICMEDSGTNHMVDLSGSTVDVRWRYFFDVLVIHVSNEVLWGVEFVSLFLFPIF